MQNEVVISAGAGYSIGLNIVKRAVNAVLKANDFEDATFIPPINVTLDYALADNFSLGAAYTYSGFTANESRMINDTLYNAKVSLTRQNIAIRPLFHFGEDETMDLYAGARLGYSIWNGDYIVTDQFGNNSEDASTIPSVFTVQLLFGVRKYFNDFVGVNFEAGIGNGPYFLAGGVSFKL